MSTGPDPADLDPADVAAAADLQRQLEAADIDLSDVKRVVDEQRATAVDADGKELSIRDLMDFGLSRRQALKALGLVLAGATWGGALGTVFTQQATAGTAQAGAVGTSANPVDVEAEDVNLAGTGELNDPAGNVITDFVGTNLTLTSGAVGVDEEGIEDIVGAMAGSNLTYDDVNDTLDASSGGFSGTTSAASPTFGTWTSVSTDPALLMVKLSAQTDGTTNASIDLAVDESGGTTADYTYQDVCFADAGLGSNNRSNTMVTAYLTGGAQFQLINDSDPAAGNVIGTARFVT